MDGGDPCIYGPTLNYLLKGFDPSIFEVIPGMGALNAAGAAMKRSLTPEGVRFVMLTSPESLFGESWEKDDTILKDLSKYETTIVLYMSLSSLTKVVEQFKKSYPLDLPIAIVYYAGYADKERVLKSNLGAIVEDIKKMDEKWLGLVIIGKCVE
jgi:precorrin-4 methylase